MTRARKLVEKQKSVIMMSSYGQEDELSELRAAHKDSQQLLEAARTTAATLEDQLKVASEELEGLKVQYTGCCSHLAGSSYPLNMSLLSLNSRGIVEGHELVGFHPSGCLICKVEIVILVLLFRNLVKLLQLLLLSKLPALRRNLRHRQRLH